jgi:leucine efflux protein
VLHIEPRHYFKQALFITLLNPKAIVFYMAFFPLFVDPARHQGLLTFGVMALPPLRADLCLRPDRHAAHALSGRAHARQPGGGRHAGKVAGVFLIGFGVKLAISK